jgi:hypothetical protein
MGVTICAVLCALPGAALAGESVKLLRSLAFAEGAMVRPEVRSECRLAERLPQFIEEYARQSGVAVELVDALPRQGRVLELEIADAVEMGNAWIGRQKGLVIQGRLLENGAQVARFRGRRMTSGGFFGGYKGTCAFFGRCAKKLGHDVAEWLKAPHADANIGG